MRLAPAPTPKNNLWLWGAAALLGSWWLSATLIILALEKMGVSHALAVKIGVWTLPGTVASAIIAAACWLCWALLKAIFAGYLAHRRVIHMVAVFTVLLATA